MSDAARDEQGSEAAQGDAGGAARAADGGLTRAERLFVRINIFQTILAVAGLFTGAVALYAALNEANAVRKQQQASVWPFVDIIVSRSNLDAGRSFDVAIANKGIGPARIRTVEVYVDGVLQPDWWTVVDVIAGLDGARPVLSNANAAATVLSAGEQRSLMRADRASAPAAGGVAADALLDRLGAAVDDERLRMKICYCSVFDDCWVHDTQRFGDATKTATCSPQSPEITY